MGSTGVATAWFCAAAHGRRHWRSLLALTLIVGFAGAVVLGAVAGARRTDSAFERMKKETRAVVLRMFGPTVASCGSASPTTPGCSRW